jgi:hypothetical protein
MRRARMRCGQVVVSGAWRSGAAGTVTSSAASGAATTGCVVRVPAASACLLIKDIVRCYPWTWWGAATR